jgi:hypothetical protein
MSSFFEDFFASGATGYVSGYDPRDNTYYITRKGDNEDTVGYDAARGVWQSRYSFTPDLYANQNNMLFSAKYTSGNNLFWKHDSATYNRFYETGYPSELQVVSKLSPSRVKVFNAISYEGDSAEWEVSTNGIETDLGQTTDGIVDWRKNEGGYYALMPRNNNTSGDYGSTTEEFFVGNLSYIGSAPGGAEKFQSTENLSRIPLPSQADNVKLNTTSANLSIENVDRENNTIILDGVDNPSSVAGSNVTISVTTTQSKTIEDVMRGHWMKIKMENDDTSKHELYCINTHITDSKSHHPLGG